MSPVAAGPEVQERDVLVVGGGIGGVEALMALADLGNNRLRIHVVAETPTFTLPPEALGVPWGDPQLHIDLEELCRAFGARFTVARAIGVDAAAHELFTADGGTLRYEQLLLATGARRAVAYADVATMGFGRLPGTLATSTPGDVAVLVPDQVTWTLPAYQLALRVAGERRRVRVITGEDTPLQAFGTGNLTAIRSFLERHGVAVETGGAPAPGTAVDDLAGEVVALPLLEGPFLAGVPSDGAGFVRVDSRTRVLGLEDVRAVGDSTSHQIKQGGLAAQQADIAATELVRACGGAPMLLPYEPILRGRLTAPDGEELYLRRALNGIDEGQSSSDPLWQPATAICAWRLARWLEYHRRDLPRPTVLS